MGTRKRYDVAFKQEAVRLVLEQGYSVGNAAARLGVNVWTLRDWVKKARESASPTPSQTATAEELQALRKQVQELERENEILKKATAYFAKDRL